jgi:hypothetical protein
MQHACPQVLRALIQVEPTSPYSPLTFAMAREYGYVEDIGKEIPEQQKDVLLEVAKQGYINALHMCLNEYPHTVARHMPSILPTAIRNARLEFLDDIVDNKAVLNDVMQDADTIRELQKAIAYVIHDCKQMHVATRVIAKLALPIPVQMLNDTLRTFKRMLDCSSRNDLKTLVQAMVGKGEAIPDEKTIQISLQNKFLSVLLILLDALPSDVELSDAHFQKLCALKIPVEKADDMKEIVSRIIARLPSSFETTLEHVNELLDTKRHCETDKWRAPALSLAWVVEQCAATMVDDVFYVLCRSSVSENESDEMERAIHKLLTKKAVRATLDDFKCALLHDAEVGGRVSAVPIETILKCADLTSDFLWAAMVYAHFQKAGTLINRIQTEYKITFSPERPPFVDEILEEGGLF